MADQMSEKVVENDLRKLHSEVNQIVAQRFNLTTIAVLVFAAICGWATAAVGRASAITPEFVALIAFLLIIVLATLFAYFMLLLGMMRIFTVYISHKYKSPWEAEWKEYRSLPNSKNYWGYSEAGRVIFQVLGFLSILFPVALFWVDNGVFSPFPLVLLWPLAAFFVYEAVVYFAMKLRNKIIDEQAISRNWDDAIGRVVEGEKKGGA